MRALVITDIHANLMALEAVLEDAGEVDAVWCLGDIVGYGPKPNECIALLKKQPNMLCVLGNHDAAALNLLDLSTFNPEARQSVEWMQTQLEAESIEFLENLPEMVDVGKATLVHGSPRHPVFEYLLDTRAATDNFNHFETDYCFVGHTHLPVMFYIYPEDYMAGLTIPPINTTTNLKPRAIINPGSVGQPRDRDPRAAYAIFDNEAETWEYRRITYDIETVQHMMEDAGLPERHIMRLEGGW